MASSFVEQLCADMPSATRPMVRELAENVEFMGSKLVETRKALEHEQVVIPYDNGGGQTGIRKNPAFEMYNTLLASYRKSIEQLISVTGASVRVAGSSSNVYASIIAEAEQVLADA